MKKVAIQAAVESHLAALGFGRGSFVWQPATAELLLVVGSTIRKLKLKSGMSRRQLEFQLGRISGWSEMHSALVAPQQAAAPQPARKANGVGNGAHSQWATAAMSPAVPSA